MVLSDIEWLDEDVFDGAVERSFRVKRSGRLVPGVLWLPPSGSAPAPLVLSGHGGSGHKRSVRVVEDGRWFAAHAGFAAVAIDGPYHGERVRAPLPAGQYQARIAEEGIEVVLDRMTDDWRGTVDAVGAVGAAGAVDPGWLACLGMSMGARFGLAVAAEMNDRFRCLVLGKFGLRQCNAMHPGMAAPERVARDAARVTASLLFHVPQDDKVFPRNGQLELFGLIGSPTKHLTLEAGPHANTTPAAIAGWRSFVAERLTDGR